MDVDTYQREGFARARARLAKASSPAAGESPVTQRDKGTFSIEGRICAVKMRRYNLTGMIEQPKPNPTPPTFRIDHHYIPYLRQCRKNLAQ